MSRLVLTFLNTNSILQVLTSQVSNSVILIVFRYSNNSNAYYIVIQILIYMTYTQSCQKSFKISVFNH